MSDVIIVLGAHGGEDQIVAGVMSKLGCTPPRSAMTSTPEGTSFEPSRLTDFHDELLASAGTMWQDWRKFNSDWYKSPLARPFKERAKILFAEEFAAAPLTFFADSRVSRFTPFWLDVLKEINAAAHIVIPIRPPADVAHALNKTHGLSVTQGLLIWLRHMLSAEVQTRNERRSMFGSSEFASDWQRITQKIFEDFSLIWPRVSDRSVYEIEQFLKLDSTGIDAAAAPDPANHSDLYKWTQRAHDALLELATNPHSNSARTTLDQIRDLFEHSSNIFGRAILEYEIELEAAHREKDSTNAAVKDQLLETQKDLTHFYDDLVGLEETLSHKDEQLRDLNAKLSKLEDEKRMATEIAAHELDELQKQLTEGTQTLKATLESTRRAERSARDDILILKEELARSNAALRDMNALSQKLSETEAKLQEQEAELHALNLRVKAAVEEKSIAIEEAWKARQQIEAADRNLAIMKQALSASEHEKKNLERVSAEQNEIHNRELARAYAEIVHFQTGLATTEKQLADTSDQLAETHRLIAAKSEENAGLQDDVMSLQRDLDGRAKTLEMHTGVFKRLDKLSHAAALKRATERELEVASRAVRPKILPLPFGLMFSHAQLRSPFMPKGGIKRKLRSERYELERWGLFDAPYYIAQNPDVAAAGVDAFAHYVQHGILEDRDPHPLFNSGWYRIVTGQRLNNMPPLLHYLRHGQGTKLSPHPLFDSDYYLNKNEDVAKQGADPFMHFRHYGAAEKRDPHPLISMERLSTQPGFETSKNVLLDYLTKPELFKASPHPLFDGETYLSDNKDVAKAGINPLLHYCAVGWREGRHPHRLFAGDSYLAKNPDVLASGLNPLYHYVRYGWLEQRDPHPLFDSRYYYSHNRDARKIAMDPLSHYVLHGAREGWRTSEKIQPDLIRAAVPAAQIEKSGPLNAFLLAVDSQISIPVNLLQGDGDTTTPLLWPPTPDPVYWLPQRLRDHILERYEEKSIGLYLYLMSVVERYADNPELFSASNELAEIVARLHRPVAQARRPQNEPDVTIILPVYNNLVFTLTCILSLLENKTRYSYEILIGDDVSSDATQSILGTVGGSIRLIRHDENLGFLANCNRCATFAKGRNLVFLNNDTLVLPGWLDELIGALESSEQIGLTGSKLINADGSLQEAGGIYWRDGTAWNFGRGDIPSLPQYNYRKDTDYISGASIALPAALWRRLDGFDPIYAPAYCEDSDLAFRIRQSGLRTLYVPHSELIHHEGKSHGSDTASGVKAYQVANQQKLFARWKPVLEAQHFFNGENVFVARDRSRGKPHILFVDHYIPQWDRDAGSRTMFHFLRMFVAAGFQVSFWPCNLYEDRQYCEPLQKMGIEVLYSAAYVDKFDSWFKANGAFFDYALVSRPHIAIHFYSALRAHSRCKILYYGHDIHHKRMELERATKDDPDFVQAIEDMRMQEADNWSRADVVLYPSTEERDAVRAMKLARRAEQVPMLGFTPSEFGPAQKNLDRFDARDFNELLFVGGSHPPNVDALLWFIKEVFPLILRANPKARLNIIGATTSHEIAKHVSKAIVLHGRVSDVELDAFYAGMGIAIVPLRFGAGVKGKTVEAFLNAIPVVSTPVGMQGLATDEPIAAIADNAEAFAKAVCDIQIAQDEAKRRVESGLAFVEDTYSIGAMQRAFAGFVPELDRIENLDLALFKELR